MQKIKIAIHSKTIGYSGTDRSAALHAKYLAKDSRFEPFLIYRGDGENSRLPIMQDILGKDHVVEYKWVPDQKTRVSPYWPKEDNIHDVIKTINPDIVHCHYSGYNEFPVFKWLLPKHTKLIGHNIFGYSEQQRQCDKIIYISNFIRNRALKAGGPDGCVLYNPIELPVPQEELPHISLRAEMGFTKDTVLLGRVGRADNFDPISLKAFAEIEKYYHGKVHYVVVNACHNWMDTAKKLEIKNITFLPAIIDDRELSRFYRSMDIYAHARSDGECCPCNIQEAMMHGLPIVTHRSRIYNGQEEIMGEGGAGLLASIDDDPAYAAALAVFIGQPEIRANFSRKASERARNLFEATKIVDRLKQIYLEVL